MIDVRVMVTGSKVVSRGAFLCLYIFFSKKPCIYKFVNSKKNTSD